MSLSSVNKSEIWNSFCDYLDPTRKRNDENGTYLFFDGTTDVVIVAENGAVSFDIRRESETFRGTGLIQSIIEEIGDKLGRAYTNGDGNITFYLRVLKKITTINAPNSVFLDEVAVCNKTTLLPIWACAQYTFQNFLFHRYNVYSRESTECIDNNYQHQGNLDGKLAPFSAIAIFLSWTLSWNPTWNLKAIPHHPLPKFEDQNVSHDNRDVWSAYIIGEPYDVSIMCQDGKIFAHKLVLRLQSKVFNAMLTFEAREVVTRSIQLPMDSSNAVAAVLKYLYLNEYPFGNQADDPSTELCLQVLPLADRLHIQPLVDNCVTYIAQHTDPAEWKDIGEIGALYKSRMLLDIYDAYRIRKGERLPIAFKDAYRMCGLPIPTAAPSCRIHPRCDVGFGNTLSIRFAPAFADDIRYEWDPSIDGWSGYAPIGKEFKFVKILRDGQIEWEKIDGNRLISEESDEILKLDVQF